MSEFRLVVGIATRGRAPILRQTLHFLQKQTYRVERVIICCTLPADIEGITPDADIEMLYSEAGLCRQRNSILDRSRGYDGLLFLDDDMLLAPDYVASVCQAFTSSPDIAVVTGKIVADGVRGPGFSSEKGASLLAEDSSLSHEKKTLPVFCAVGGNMAFRLSTIFAFNLRFDECLPLYGWYEDIDFTRLVGKYGKIVKLNHARCVHLGSKVGRVSGKRLGYSQIANPIYLSRKGTFPWNRTIGSIARNVTANCAKALFPEPYIDRVGRLSGNFNAFADLLRGSIRPEKILKL